MKTAWRFTFNFLILKDTRYYKQIYTDFGVKYLDQNQILKGGKLFLRIKKKKNNFKLSLDLMRLKGNCNAGNAETILCPSSTLAVIRLMV